jgi:ubiquinone/menaquinone biosynthesis C-methylase UbiE
MERKSIALDIGAGTGNLTKLVHDIGYTVIGIEPADKMRKKFQKKFPSLIIMRGDFRNIPLRDDYADVIVSSYVWHHLTLEEKEQSIHEMSRVLKEQGLIVIADLMFADQGQRATKINHLKQRGQNDIIEDIESEYYADVNQISECFIELGFRFDSKQMTDYVWIVRAQRLPR